MLANGHAHGILYVRMLAGSSTMRIRMRNDEYQFYPQTIAEILAMFRAWAHKEIRRKKTSELEKLRTFRTLFLAKTWNLGLAVNRVCPEKVPSGQSKNKLWTSALPTYLFYIRYVSHPSTYVGFNTYTLDFYVRPMVNYSNECHFPVKSPT